MQSLEKRGKRVNIVCGAVVYICSVPSLQELSIQNILVSNKIVVVVAVVTFSLYTVSVRIFLLFKITGSFPADSLKKSVRESSDVLPPIKVTYEKRSEASSFVLHRALLVLQHKNRT